jgi:cell division protein FtsW (lipid II flippase)/cell division protein FtsI/penicillin-binding protein 2
VSIPDRIAGIKVSERGRDFHYADRNAETVRLLLATLIVGLGLFLVYQAKSAGRFGDGELSFAQIDQALTQRQLLNLNTSPRADQILSFLQPIDDEADRRFAAQQLETSLRGERSFNSVGLLSAIRVGEEELRQSRLGIKSYAKRLAEAQDGVEGPAAREVRISLLPQLSRLRSFFVVRTPAQFRNQLLFSSFLCCIAFYLVHIVWRRRGFCGDQMILPVIHLLTGLGLIMSVSYFDPLRDRMYFSEFAQGVVVGCGLLLLASLFDFQRSELRKLSLIPLALSFVLSILLIIFGSAPSGSNAKVNLNVGAFTFQPVEVITKLLVLFLAGYFAANWEFLRELKEEKGALAGPLRKLGVPRLSYFVPVMVGMVLAVLFFLKQQDLGPALIMYCSFLVLYGVARGRGTLMIIGLAMLIGAFALSYNLNRPATIRPRIDMWLSPWDNESKGGDQIARSLWTFSSGATFGTGVGLSDVGESGTLPAGHTDLMLAVIGEELGFAGVVMVFLLFAVLTYRGLHIALNSSGTYSFFLVLGLTVTVVFQLLLIAGGALGLLPLSGVITPFLSVGRSAMLMNFLAFGIVLAVSAQPLSSKNKVFLPSIRVFAGVAALLTIVVLGKAAYVQIFRSDELLVASSKALQADGHSRVQQNPRISRIAGAIERGTIYDRNGIPLATSRWTDLEKDRQRLESLNIRIEDLDRKGQKRLYPFGSETFYLLGDLNTGLNWGVSNTRFIEHDLLTQLRGFESYEELISLLRYRYLPEHESVKRIRDRVRDVHASIDVDLQLRTARILREQLERSKEDKGAIVVLDADTGEVLASVSYPVPGPGQKKDIIDRARFGLRPPGSSFKIVTAMAALRNKPELRQTSVDCVPLAKGGVGTLIPGWRPIRDDVKDQAHGNIGMERAIAKSCNAYFARLGTLEVGAESLLATARAFERITRPTPVTAQTFQDALPFVSYGQNVDFTPYEMALVAATIANGGEIPAGTWFVDNQAKERRPFLNRSDADFLAKAMRSVVTEGTAADLRDVSPSIAGKTGTAEVENQRSHSWFIGFAPYDGNGKRIAFSIIIEEGTYGSKAAVPVARNLVIQLRELKFIR